MTLHLKSRGYPFRPRLRFSSFIVVGVGFPTVYYFRRGHIDGFCPKTHLDPPASLSLVPIAPITNLLTSNLQPLRKRVLLERFAKLVLVKRWRK